MTRNAYSESKCGAGLLGGLLALGFVILLGPTLPESRACPCSDKCDPDCTSIYDPCHPDCCDFDQCNTCEDGVCHPQCDPNNCEECVDDACVNTCDASQCKECCDGVCQLSDHTTCETCCGGVWCPSELCCNGVCCQHSAGTFSYCIGGACVTDDIIADEDCQWHEDFSADCTEGACQGSCSSNSDCSGGVTEYHEYDCEGTHNCASPATCHTDGGSIELPWKVYKPCDQCFGTMCVTGSAQTDNHLLQACVCN